MSSMQHTDCSHVDMKKMCIKIANRPITFITLQMGDYKLYLLQ